MVQQLLKGAGLQGQKLEYLEKTLAEQMVMHHMIYCFKS